MKKNWDNLKAGDTIYRLKYDDNIWHKAEVLDISSKGYVILKVQEIKDEYIYVMHLTKLKKECVLTKEENDYYIAKSISIKEKITQYKDLVKHEEKYIKQTKDMLSNFMKELKQLEENK